MGGWRRSLLALLKLCLNPYRTFSVFDVTKGDGLWDLSVITVSAPAFSLKAWVGRSNTGYFPQSHEFLSSWVTIGLLQVLPSPEACMAPVTLYGACHICMAPATSVWLLQSLPSFTPHFQVPCLIPTVFCCLANYSLIYRLNAVSAFLYCGLGCQ